MGCKISTICVKKTQLQQQEIDKKVQKIPKSIQKNSMQNKIQFNIPQDNHINTIQEQQEQVIVEPLSQHTIKVQEKEVVNLQNSTTQKQESKTNKPFMYIAFGSQTGTAEKYSSQLEEDCEELMNDFTIQILDLEDFEKIQNFSSSIIIYIVATHYEGLPTDNSANFIQ